MGCRIAARRDIGDLDIARGKEFGKVIDDALLVERHDINSVGHAVCLDGLHVGLADRDAQAAVLAELIEALFEAVERVPLPGHEQQHREFGTQGRHAAFLDIAATRQNDLGQILHDTCSVCSNS